MDPRQQLAGGLAPRLPLPQSAQAHRRPQLQRLRLLREGDRESSVDTGLRLLLIWNRLLQHQLSVEAIDLSLEKTLVSGLHHRQSYVECRQSLRHLAHVTVQVNESTPWSSVRRAARLTRERSVAAHDGIATAPAPHA
jgi:hypothetical protein